MLVYCVLCVSEKGLENIEGIRVLKKIDCEKKDEKREKDREGLSDLHTFAFYDIVCLMNML